MIDLMVIGYFLQRRRSEQGAHLRLEAPGEKSVYVVVAVICKYKASIEHVLMEMGAFLRIELHQFVSADIAEWILEDVRAFEVDHLFLQIDGQGRIFYQ